jgi:hypothetical protein
MTNLNLTPTQPKENVTSAKKLQIKTYIEEKKSSRR